MNQRWRHHSTVYRPAGEVICTTEYEVALINSDREAKAFVLAHHAFGTYPAARLRFGLYHRGDLVGVAMFSHPCNDLVLTRVFRCNPVQAVELGRLSCWIPYQETVKRGFWANVSGTCADLIWWAS
jgi:hypothetical protein